MINDEYLIGGEYRICQLYFLSKDGKTTCGTMCKQSGRKLDEILSYNNINDIRHLFIKLQYLSDIDYKIIKYVKCINIYTNDIQLFKFKMLLNLKLIIILNNGILL